MFRCCTEGRISALLHGCARKSRTILPICCENARLLEEFCQILGFASARMPDIAAFQMFQSLLVCMQHGPRHHAQEQCKVKQQLLQELHVLTEQLLLGIPFPASLHDFYSHQEHCASQLQVAASTARAHWEHQFPLLQHVIQCNILGRGDPSSEPASNCTKRAECNSLTRCMTLTKSLNAIDQLQCCVMG